jgi:hypothetical protein
LATCACIVANCFGDRWTYLEITGLLWVLAGAAIRATHLTESEPIAVPAEVDSTNTINPYIAYR